MSSIDTEITEIPPLSAGETSLLNLHSVLNVLNVLHGELMILGYILADDAELLRPALALCEQFQASLIDPVESLRQAAALGETTAAIEGTIGRELASRPGSEDQPEVRESLANIQSVFRIFEVRAREILARSQAPEEWVEMSTKGLREEVHDVFAAIEKNSHGRYRILYNRAIQEPSDYYVDFAVESQNERVIWLPVVFKDVMRDLMANARKYTAPGGTISAGLYETPSELRFAVVDTGRGIPAGELQTVVHYGKRGSNVEEVRTMGGGFGLTKAFLVTKQFGGRFWVGSELGVGTRVRISIPRPGVGA